jgi:hypothetical protein
LGEGRLEDAEGLGSSEGAVNNKSDRRETRGGQDESESDLRESLFNPNRRRRPPANA